jgi:hypothetical protein
MKKSWLLSAALVALSGSMFADSIYGPGSNGNTFTVGPTSGFCCSPVTPESNSANLQTPFWNNYSTDTINSDTNHTNVGDILAGSSTGTNLIGSNLSGGSPSVLGTSTTISGSYYALTNAAGGDPAATNTGNTNTTMTPALDFSFQSNQTSFAISLLFADSGNNTGVTGSATSIGTYIMEGSTFTVATVIDGAVANNTTGTAQSLSVANPHLVVNSGTVYGFYATVCYNWSGSVCTASITYTTDNGNFVTPGSNTTNIPSGSGWLGSLGWNHFALFELTSGEEVVGFEDSPWALSNANAVEGEGDFNDIVIGLVGSSSSSAPEPGTIAIMGLGLAGLGLIGRRRFAKK